MTDYRKTQAVTFPEGTPRSAAFAFAADLGRCLHDLEMDINKAMEALERYADDDSGDTFASGVALVLALREALSDLDKWQKLQAALELAASDLPYPSPNPPTVIEADALAAPPRNCDVGSAEQQAADAQQEGDAQ
ncbi:MAG: hypothetical protein IKO55_06440 [Kiritimatiellae bacterium]|nr:hypothetical protein [Kiritimatiellia bacterium]